MTARPPSPMPEPGASALRVNEIFRSLQGEGARAGRPCVFVRLSGCDVGCAWCDTVYAQTEPGRELTIPFIMESVRQYGPRLVQITGGEPLLQPDSAHLAWLLAREGYQVLVETSGTRDISVLPPPVVRIMDIKTPSSGVADKFYRENLNRLRPEDEIKFVIADRADYEFARDLVETRNLSGKAVVLFGAVWNRLDPAELADWILFDYLDVRLQVQLHRILWPAVERGR